ncbi:MAG TPA: PfkB family carbohydrate kinase [Myxococcota bacterium]|nr:PfkB family carbohydrate kinase [Myxococcota bacterium]
MSLLVVGTLAFDSVETPFGRRDDVLGGSASFLATSASYFAPVHMAGVIGEDFPEGHINFFRSRNIDLSGLQKMPGRTFRWKGHYSHDLNVAQTLETQLNVLETFEPKLPETYRDAEYVVLGNIDPELQQRVLDQVRKPKLVACDTMNFWIERHNAKLRKTLERVDLLSVNDAEARQLSGEYNLVKAARAIRAMGPRIVVIKRGEYGALLFCEDGTFAAPAMPLEVVCDPTGAGDTFAGGLMGFIARRGRVDGHTLRQAVLMGSAMASFVVEDFSLDRLRRVSLDDLGARVKELHGLTHLTPEGLHAL